MVRALGLADVLRGAGLPVVEVAGWQGRGLELSGIRGGVVHHTGTPASAGGDYPSMGVVRDGRSGLPGPLAQLGLGRSGTWYVIAAGKANHAGVVHAQYAGTYANPYSLGVEAEHPGGSAPWPAVQYASYVRGCAVLADAYGISWLGHKEVAAPAGRKVDPNFDMTRFRQAVSMSLVSNPIGGGGGSIPNVPTIPGIDPIEPTGDADMPLTQTDLDLIEQRVAKTNLENLIRGPEFLANVSKAVWERQLKQATDEGPAVMPGGLGPASAETFLVQTRQREETLLGAVLAITTSPVNVDELATALGAILGPILNTLPDSDVERVAEATADLFSTRLSQ